VCGIVYFIVYWRYSNCTQPNIY